MEEFKLAMKVAIDAVLNDQRAEMTEELKGKIIDGLINMLRVTCQDEDRYHLVVGFLNRMRLEHILEDRPDGDSNNSS